MELKKTIVVLYGKDKHEFIAQGIKEKLSQNKEFDVLIIDDKAFTPNISASLSKRFYIFLHRNANWLYSILSGMEERKAVRFFHKQRKKRDAEEDIASKADKLKQRISYVKNIMLRFNPTVTICLTHGALKMALAARDMYNINTQVVAFTADFGTDLRFLDIRCDKYFVANEEAVKRFVKVGISKQNVIMAGIPYRLDKNLPSLDEIKRDLDITNDEPVVVVSGGKYGSLRIFDDFNKICGSICNFNLIALSGGNKKLGALLRTAAPAESNKNIKVIESYDMNKLLKITDVFVTVPATEDLLRGIIHGCALIAIDPLSALEKSNYSFLKSNDIAKTSKSAHLTSLAVTELLLEEKEKRKLLERSSAYINNMMTETGEIMLLMDGNKEEIND
ncbi:MAG: MGDG synthase family glycosyltransferase [Christensenellales bacterium]|jgi:UDP-N-acetylglucosamine:LPS N-acetylglucosamine transferase